MNRKKNKFYVKVIKLVKKYITAVILSAENIVHLSERPQ